MMRPWTAAVLLALALACHTSDSAPEAKPMPTRITEVTPQRQPTRLVVAGTRIASLGTDQLTITETHPWHVDTIKLPGARSIGVLDGDIAVGTRDDKTGATALVRFAAGDTKGTRIEGNLAIPTRGTGRIAAAGKPTEVFVAEEDYVARTKLDGGKPLPVQLVEWKRDELRTFTPAGNGRVAYVEGDQLVVLGPADGKATFALGDWNVPTHIAAGPRDDTMWITAGDQVGLATLAAGTAKVSAPTTLGATAYHLASAGDFAAVLAASGAGKLVGEVVVVGADHKIRWRAKLPPVATLEAFIAASPEVVAVQSGDQLFAWNAKDGTPIKH